MRANPPRPGGNIERRLLLFSSLSLVVTFIRGLGPVAERSGSTVNTLRFVFELAMAIGVVGLGFRVLKAARRDGTGQVRWLALMVVGTFAALGVFVIRLSDALSPVSMPPRPTQSRIEHSKEPSGVPPDLSRRYRELMEEQKKKGENSPSASPKRSPN